MKAWRIDRVLFIQSVGIRVEGFNFYGNEPFGWSFGHLGEYALQGSSYFVAEDAKVECNISVLRCLRRHADGKHEDARKTAISLLHRAFTEDHVKLWMKHHQENQDDLTQIVEEAARYFEQDHEGGPLDQPDHWIWFTPKAS